MKRKWLAIGIITILSFVILGGCTVIKPVVEGTGTIVWNDFEGGFYGIIADAPMPKYPTNNLDPTYLPEEFREDGLRVWFKIRLRPDLWSFHMWGIIVDVLEIHEI